METGHRETRGSGRPRTGRHRRHRPPTGGSTIHGVRTDS